MGRPGVALIAHGGGNELVTFPGDGRAALVAGKTSARLMRWRDRVSVARSGRGALAVRALGRLRANIDFGQQPIGLAA